MIYPRYYKNIIFEVFEHRILYHLEPQFVSDNLASWMNDLTYFFRVGAKRVIIIASYP